MPELEAALTSATFEGCKLLLREFPIRCNENAETDVDEITLAMSSIAKDQLLINGMFVDKNLFASLGDRHCRRKCPLVCARVCWSCVTLCDNRCGNGVCSISKVDGRTIFFFMRDIFYINTHIVPPRTT